ncbi:MAG: helix-turn-helix transcriptional regulator [Vampirovibrionales bacterium]|nr:helix-turn-helix transcriptional regulator [Vampirovibrionales bacterium]
MTLLGDRLKELRANFSLMDIAREVGLSDVQILNFEKGTRKPRKETLKKLAALYHVSYGELRKLYYTDLFSEDSEERRIILEWAKEAQE